MFSWISFMTYAMVTAITPGPNNIMSMSNGSSVGFRRALPFNFGIFGGFCAVIAICTLFSSIFALLIPKVEIYMLCIGAAYILYLAWNTLMSGSIVEGNGVKNSFLAGFLLQFINPKLYIYGIVSMEIYILPHYANNIPALLGFAFLLSFIGFFCTVLWSGFGSIFKVLFSKYAKITNAIMALLLVYCAVSLFL